MKRRKKDLLKLAEVFMKRELGIARCGLACCLCSENITCHGCNSGECPDKDVYYGKNVPPFRRNGYRKSGTMIP